MMNDNKTILLVDDDDDRELFTDVMKVEDPNVKLCLLKTG